MTILSISVVLNFIHHFAFMQWDAEIVKIEVRDFWGLEV